MLPRLQTLFLALMTALLLILGTMGIFSAEASTFRSTMRDAEAYDRSDSTRGYGAYADTYMVSEPGLPY
jgi:hypothetical protein